VDGAQAQSGGYGGAAPEKYFLSFQIRQDQKIRKPYASTDV
jgi:hypothetical protein